MKLPKFNFNDSYPLTLGVADDYFTLSTRLKRLNRAPHQPRRGATWLLCAALLISFGAVLPIRLTARAQSEFAEKELSGTVKYASGQPVADATVYAMKWQDFGGLPLETVTADGAGRYRFSGAVSERQNIVIFADAGARGFGQGAVWRHGRDLRVSNPIVSPMAPVKLLLLAPDGKRAANLPVRVGQIGGISGERWSVPRSVSSALQTVTNARGEAIFPRLPRGAVARFYLQDHKFIETKYGPGDLRGGQYAPIAGKDAVEIGASNAWKTIRLVASIHIEGRVTTPDGQGKNDVLVTARRVNERERKGDFNAREMLLAQTRTDAGGRYVMAGLRPGRTHLELPPEKTLARDYVGPVMELTLKNSINVVNFPLARGGVIRGVVRKKGGNAPLVGQTVGLVDAKRVYQYEKTGASGAFQFRAHPGDAILWIQRSGDKLPVKVSTGKLTLHNLKIFQYKDEGQDELWLATASSVGKITMNPRFVGEVSGIKIFNPSELVLLPIKANATREITIESALKPAKETTPIRRATPTDDAATPPG